MTLYFKYPVLLKTLLHLKKQNMATVLSFGYFAELSEKPS